MNNKQEASKQGQAIVIMAFAIIALAALVGLAIDGGNLYTLRRRAQIGADSTAMAGTQMLADLISQCAAPAAGQDSAIRDQILEYARLNGVDAFSPNGEVQAWYIDKNNNSLGFVGDGGLIPSGATGISTRLVTTDTTTFMRLFGFSTIAAPGEATAIAGQITQMGGGGLLPIAVWDEVVMNLGPGTPFTILGTGEFKDFCEVTCPECCEGPAGSSAQRGWLQLGHIYNKDSQVMDRAFTTSTSANDNCHKGDADFVKKAGLGTWLNPDCPYPYSIYAGHKGLDDGDFILGSTGTMASGLKEIEQTWLNKVSYAPVFDLIFKGTGNKHEEPTMETIFNPDEPMPISTWVGGQSTYYYHIIGYVAVKLTGVQGHNVTGEFQYHSIQAHEINPGNGFGPGSHCVPGLVGILLSE